MSLRIGIGTNLRIQSSGINWASYWATRYPSGLTAVVDSDTQITLYHKNNGIQDYDEISYEADNGSGYLIVDIAIAGSISKAITSLIANTSYNFRIRYRKGTEYSVYSNVCTVMTYAAEAIDLIDSMIAAAETPLDTRKVVLDTTIKSLISNSLFNTQFDVFVVLRGTGTVSSKINWIKNAHHALGVPNGGTLTFVNDVGYSTDGTNSYLRTQYNPLDDGVLFQKNDCCFVMKISGTLGVSCMHGCADGSVNGVVISIAAGNMRLNCINTPVGLPYQVGWNCVTRAASAGFNVIRNAAKNDNSIASTLVPDLEAYILRLNFATPFYAANTEIDELYAWGKSITQANFNILQTIMNTYCTSLAITEGSCWFTRTRILYNSSIGKTWIGMSYNPGAGCSQYILTLDHSTGAKTYTKVGSVNVLDDHNEPSFLVRASDNKLFTCYSEADTGFVIRYRLSTNALDATAWGAETTIAPNGAHIYRFPSCFQVTNGNIYIFYADILGGLDYGCAYVKSTDEGVTFGARVPFLAYLYCIPIQSTTNKNIIHFIASKRPHQLGNPNYVVHFYFDASTEKWYKSDGTDITANLPALDNFATRIRTLAHPEQSWIEDIILDSSGYPRVLMTYYPDVVGSFNTKYLYYSEWTGASWTTPYEIHLALDREMSGGAGLQFPPVAHFDRGNPNRIFASKDVAGITEIFEITRIASNNFTSVQRTTGSVYDQWRPFTSDAPIYNVFWLKKEVYNTYSAFTEQLMMRTF